jgi:Fic family protein
MVYIYKKRIGEKDYYYLRASSKKQSKKITKDIAYLGNNPEEIREKLSKLPSKYSEEIRKAYKTIRRFIEVNYYLEKIKSQKLKKEEYLSQDSLEKVEACKLHFQSSFQKLDNLTKKEVFKNFVVEFAFNTASIEGNTITLKEAQKLLMENTTPKNKTLREVYDLQNTEDVFLWVLDNLKNELNHEFICKIHDALLKNIDERKGYRKVDVRVFKSSFDSTPAPYVLTDMKLLLKWYNENKNKIHPLVLATIFHHKFEKIHPFMDGNGRTGRMLLNFILLSTGYPPLIIRRKNRKEYISFLSNADKCNLTEHSCEYYSSLLEFAAKEMNEIYWNIFL